MTGKTQRNEPETATPPAVRTGHPLMTLRDEVDRLFDNFFPMARGMFEVDPFRRVGAAFRSMGDIAPEVDVREMGDRIEIAAELPGVDENDVSVTVKDGVLSISGEKKSERKEEKTDYHLTERSYGSFVRSFRLPETCDDEHIAADFSKGVLTVTIPKRELPESGEKKIEIKGH
ncbi:MAG: Hsp20/alpha crystallin family protein [Solirubrobacterales bacterium]